MTGCLAATATMRCMAATATTTFTVKPMPISSGAELEMTFSTVASGMITYTAVRAMTNCMGTPETINFMEKMAATC